MKVKIDKMPTKSQECLFSCRMYHTGYVCNLSGQKNICNVETCKYLKVDETNKLATEKNPIAIEVPNDYTILALRTADLSLDDDKRLLEGLVGMNSEAGEALDIWKKHEFQGHKLNETELAMELGDVLWYLVEAIDALGYSLETIMKMNIKKLQERYPNGFDPEKSRNRKEGQ